MTDGPRRCPGRWLLVDRWRGGGDVVAIASPRSGRGSRPSLSLLADTSGRSGERMELMRGGGSRRNRREARNWRRWRRHPSPWFSLFLFCLLLCSSLSHHLKEENEDDAGRMSDRRGAALVLFLPVRSVSLLFPSLFAFVLSLYIIRYVI